MNYTKHAAIRTQQRVIPELVVDLLLQFGAREKAPGGASKAFLIKLRAGEFRSTQARWP